MSAKEVPVSKGLTCEPLDNIEEVMTFLDDPPAWRSLCKPLNPHSTHAIRNMDLIEKYGKKQSEKSIDNYCHFELSSQFDRKRHEKKKLPKTLVCHDLDNGYHEDSLIDGTTNHEAYNFYNWAGIDIFCYFSHHFITIPPLSWINVGHKHGVKVIGTIITERKEGEDKWNAILESETKWREFACAVAAIAKCMRFDGWLLNVENKIEKPQQLLKFVGYLRSVLHEEVPGSLLVWYDSVTVTGHLAWQNGLNQKNQAFFDASDGFFTNYSWNEKDIQASVIAAGNRLHDLFIGIDVWGRNFYGGGKFNTVEAVKVANKYDCSLAIFAPAWTHEAIPTDAGPHSSRIKLADSLTRFDNFLLRDRALWGSLWPYLNTQLPCRLPFQTSFCRGQGVQRRLHGEDISSVPWYNLRHMEYQPNSSHGGHGYLLVNEDQLQFRTDLAEPEDEAVSPSKVVRKEQASANNGDNITKTQELTSNDNSDYDLPGYDLVDEDILQLQTEDPELTNKVIPEDEVAPKDVDNDKVDEPEASNKEKRSLKRIAKVNKEILLVVVPKERPCLEYHMSDAFSGGSCLKVNPADGASKEHRSIRLMQCDFFVEEAVVVCVVTKTLEDRNQYLNIILKVKDCDGRPGEVLLCGNENLSSGPAAEAGGTYAVDGVEFEELQKHILRESPHFYVPAENSFGWTTRYYLVNKPGMSILTVACRTGLREGAILLGHFGLCQKKTNFAEEN